MSEALKLSSLFITHLNIKEPSDLSFEELEAILAEVFNRAQNSWPQIHLKPEDFIAYLASRVSLEQGIQKSLSHLHVDQLYLACACGQQDPFAIEYFERYILSDLEAVLKSSKFSPSTIQEIKQDLRFRILVGSPEQPAKINQYSGRGTLSSWIKVIAVRAAQKSENWQAKHQDLDENQLARAAVGPMDQELQYLKLHYRSEFKDAFQKALRSLDRRQRNILRYHYLEGLNIEQIGTIYNVHRSTIARWLGKIRETLMQVTREEMIHVLQLKPSEFESIMDLIKTQLDISIQKFLNTQSED